MKGGEWMDKEEARNQTEEGEEAAAGEQAE